MSDPIYRQILSSSFCSCTVQPGCDLIGICVYLCTFVIFSAIKITAKFLPLFCIHKFGIVVQVQVMYCVVEFIVLGVFENVMLYCMYYIVIFMYIPAFMCIATVTKMDTKIWS